MQVILAQPRSNFTEVYLAIAQHYIAGRTLVDVGTQREFN